MKRIGIALFFWVAACGVTEKSICLRVDCKDTIPDFQDSVSLNAEAGPDPGNKLKHVRWVSLSGPSSPAIMGDTKPTAMVRGLIPGVYIFALIAISENGTKQTAYDTVVVIKTDSTAK